MSATKEYINKHINDVMLAVQGSGIFPEVAISQSALESSWGKSLLASKYNNYFGIKASRDWKGETITLKTDEVYSGVKSTINGTFRVYDSFLDSVRDYVKFLKENPRYTSGGVFKATSPEEQIKRLKDSGYATGLDYTQSVINVLKYNRDFIEDKISEYLKNSPAKALLVILLFAGVVYSVYKLSKLNK